MTTQATARQGRPSRHARHEVGSVGLAILAAVATIAVAVVAGVVLGRAVAPDSVLGDWRTAFEEREAPANDTEEPLEDGEEEDPFALDDADTYGDDPELDELWDECDGGDGDACDLLFLRSPFGSEYEEFGRTCGGREDDDFFGVCGEGLDAGLPSEYGDDPELDVLWDACDGGDLGACDDLWFSSPAGSAYEEFGATCGDRVEEGFADCESRAG
jgi:hypothetical protein